MKPRNLLCLLLVLVCLTPPFTARADRQYLIPDSNTRLLTWAELDAWDRHSLSYVFNEIFARHGYVFNPGGQYDQWFRQQPWYHPNANPDNDKYCLPKVSDLEWKNYYLIKNVIAAKDASGEKSHLPGKECINNYTPAVSRYSLSGFSYLSFSGAKQLLPVYSAPSTSSWRGNNGKAEVSTNGAIYCAGYENGWMLIYYELTGGVNAGGIRVGYIRGLEGKYTVNTYLSFAYTRARVVSSCALTDDPLKAFNTITHLSSGTEVTYLSTFINQSNQCWDYIETRVGGQTVRGFVPEGSLDVPFVDNIGK